MPKIIIKIVTICTTKYRYLDAIVVKYFHAEIKKKHDTKHSILDHLVQIFTCMKGYIKYSLIVKFSSKIWSVKTFGKDCHNLP